MDKISEYQHHLFLNTVDENGWQDEDLGEVASSLSIQSYKDYHETEELDVLDGAITFARIALFYTDRGHANEGGRMDNLGNMLQSRYDRSGDVSFLDEGITIAQTALDDVSKDDPGRPICLNNLAVKLITRFKRFNNRADLDSAVAHAQEALSLTPRTSPSHAIFVNCVSNLLDERYKLTNDMADLDASITAAEQLVTSSSPMDPHRSVWQRNLAVKLGNRYLLENQRQDLDRSIEWGRTALASARRGPDRALCLDGLTEGLERRYDRFGALDDLCDAAKFTRQLVEQTPRDHPLLAQRRRQLCVVSNNLFERSQDVAHLNAALDVIDAALQDADPTLGNDADNPFGLSSFLDSKATLLLSRYERFGEPKDLQSSIELSQKLVEMSPPFHETRVARLSNLAWRLYQRHLRTEVMADLELAISTVRKGISEAFEGHPCLSACHGNLGNMLLGLFERTKDLSDLDSAAVEFRLALFKTPPDHPDRPKWLFMLGMSLGRRWDDSHSCDLADLESAISVTQEAIDLTPVDHADRVARLSSLSTLLELKYRRADVPDLDVLEQSIVTAREALDATPEDHPDRTMCCSHLANRLQRRYEHTKEMEDFGEAYSFYLEAWNNVASIPFHRVRNAVPCLRMAHLLEDHDTALSIAKDAIPLLPAVDTQALSQEDRQAVMATFAGVAAHTCAAFLEAGDDEAALLSLEKCRVVTLGKLIDGWSDIDRLTKDLPKLAKRFKYVEEMAQSSSEDAKDLETATDASDKSLSTRQRELASCLEYIRSLPGYQQFMLEESTADMRACASDGTIIIVNITEIRSDAIIVSSTSVKSMKLSKIVFSEVEKWLRNTWAVGRSERAERGAKNKEYREYLIWLWEKVVADVLRAVDLGPVPVGDPMPRIWWIGTGLASWMPFHAAGHHAPTSSDNVFCRAISSYTPSIKALSFSRGRARKTPSVGSGFLLATMSTTPGASSLPGVMHEKKGILQAVDGKTTVETFDQPDAKQVLERLEKCSIAHFACHGQTDQQDPSRSGLLLQKTATDGSLVVDELTVQQVSNITTSHARVAYLSACSTAEHKSIKLSDEVIHVASGFQVAGFAHVIGCLWPTPDSVCVEIASEFYTSLVRGTYLSLENHEIAESLHRSVNRVRTRDWKAPLNWAQFVHYGA